jgi:hypothetical protein
MKLFTCTDHDNFWPVGAASIALAENEEEAHELLKKALEDHGLSGEDFTLQEVDLNSPQAVILCDGSY